MIKTSHFFRFTLLSLLLVLIHVALASAIVTIILCSHISWPKMLLKIFFSQQNIKKKPVILLRWKLQRAITRVTYSPLVDRLSLTASARDRVLQQFSLNDFHFLSFNLLINFHSNSSCIDVRYFESIAYEKISRMHLFTVIFWRRCAISVVYFDSIASLQGMVVMNKRRNLLK